MRASAALVAVSGLLLTACATVPAGPSVMALPGTGKTFEQFQGDDGACRQWALQQSGVASDAATRAPPAAPSSAHCWAPQLVPPSVRQPAIQRSAPRREPLWPLCWWNVRCCQRAVGLRHGSGPLRRAPLETRAPARRPHRPAAASTGGGRAAPPPPRSLALHHHRPSATTTSGRRGAAAATGLILLHLPLVPSPPLALQARLTRPVHRGSGTRYI